MSRISPNRHASSIMNRVAREAATLLYSQQEKEYKQAKHKAAEILGVRILPSNRKIAEELDKIADEMEGPGRRDRLVQMRKEALSVMIMLGDFHPRLVGSAWRGTARRNSDIDVEVFATDPKIVHERLEKHGLNIQRAEMQSMTKGDVRETAFHIFMALSSGSNVEVVVRHQEKMSALDKCEIYGDIITGLNIHQLRRVLMEDPNRKFVPA